MEKIITQNELLELIDINPPYFALDEIRENDDWLYATLPSEQPLCTEKGPITAAELSRHLAILGVCSSALANPTKQRHYYLAYRGIYERVSDTIPETSKLTGRAKCLSINRKKAEAETELLDNNGNVVVKLHVFYHVILDTTFERLYKEHYSEKPDFIYKNPYSIIHEFKNTELYGDEIRCSMGIIPEALCAGHFPNYPALPVAILVYNLFNMASKLVTNSNEKTDCKTIVKSYEINADNLAFAGDNVELKVSSENLSNDSGIELFAEGIANDTKSIGRINLVIETIKEHNNKSVSATK